MVEVKGLQKIYSHRVTGKYGESDKIADPAFKGIYHRRHRKYGVIIVKEKLYKPTNPRTEKQQAWRAVFAAGVEAWQTLTNQEKMILDTKAQPLGLEGFNLYMRRWLRSHYEQE